MIHWCCSIVDSTAARAEAAGALVLVRSDETLRGKGHALKFAFDRFLAEGIADAEAIDAVAKNGFGLRMARRFAQSC